MSEYQFNIVYILSQYGGGKSISRSILPTFLPPAYSQYSTYVPSQIHRVERYILNILIISLSNPAMCPVFINSVVYSFVSDFFTLIGVPFSFTLYQHTNKIAFEQSVQRRRFSIRQTVRYSVHDTFTKVQTFVSVYGYIEALTSF